MSKQELRLSAALKMLPDVKPEDLPDFIKKLYLGELDKELDAVFTDGIIDKELRTLSFICVMAYREAILKCDDMKPHLAVYKLKAAALRPYFRANHGFTIRFAYYFYLKLGDNIRQKDIFKLAESLGVGKRSLYKQYLRVSYHKIIDEKVMAEAKEMLAYMDF